MTQAQENQERSVPKPHFTDAEAGAKTFPDSTKREYNYYKPAKRKQSRYEDVTVEVQPDPRHYLAQGWLYGFADGKGGYPLDWTALKAWGSDRPEPERFPGSGGKGYDWPAHLATWNEDPAWQGVHELAEQLTGIDDWCEAIFAANIVFEPLVGELFRSQLVMQAAPRNGDFVTPTLVGAEEYDFAERDLRYTKPMFHLLTNDREFADHNKAKLSEWLGTWTGRSLAAARTLQPLWSQPENKPLRFEDSLDAVKSRFAGILADINLDAPKELGQ